MLVAAPPERRVATRYQPAFGTVCHLGHGRPVVALVWNISETGLSMLLANPPEPGEELPGEIAFDGWEVGLPVHLRVVHVRKASTGDYVVGAKFSRPLGAEEVRRFVTPPQDDGGDVELPQKG